MKTCDPLFAGLILAVGIVYEVMALWMPRGTLGQPGPGFFPMLVGVFLILSAAACLVQSLGAGRLAGSTGPAAGQAAPGPSRRQPRQAWLLLGLLGLYALALKPLGFPFAIAAVVMASIRIFGYRKWLPTLGIAVALTVVSYAVFITWLKVPLPLGILDDLLD